MLFTRTLAAFSRLTASTSSVAATVAQPPGNPQPEAQGALLAAFRASLTGHRRTFAERVPSCAGLRLLTADVFVPTGATPAGDADAASTGSPADGEFIPPQEWCRADEPAPGTDGPAGSAALADDGWPAHADGPDPDIGRLAGLDPLTDEDWRALTGPPPQPPRTAWPEGIVPPDGFLSPQPATGGPGFGEGDPLDLAAAGLA
ncbi:MAG: hypothetical protein ACRDNF_06415, partial [Streptosporangiaceae bacterium]